eukprot:Gb_37400 [translate_table: standard]
MTFLGTGMARRHFSSRNGLQRKAPNKDNEVSNGYKKVFKKLYPDAKVACDSFPLQCRNKEKDKKNTDTNRQKKPLLPYILWCREQWSQVKSENPNASFKEIGAILGEKWKSSTVEDKKPYQDKYQAEKEAYLQILGQQKRETEGLKILHEEQKQKTALELLEQYLQYKKDAEEDKSKSKRREKDPLKPKQPISAFFAFCKEHRAALMGENHNILEIAKILGEQWKTMSKEMRAPYEQVASEAKERYMQEMVLYKQRKAEEAYAACKVEEEQGKVEREHAMQLLRKKEREDMLKKNLKEKSQLKKKPKAENSDPTRPKKPPTSYILFCKEARGMFAQERPGASHTTINALISVKWKELSEAEKQIWINKAAGALAQYKQEMELYKKTLKEQTKTQPLLELAESSLSITC